MDDENIFERIEDIFGHFPENISILEERIDIDLQMEYFEFSRNFRKGRISGNALMTGKKLFNKDHARADKKKILVQLAALEEVEAYRTIEKYLKDPDPELRDWAVLAFQESRMLLQSRLLDENQVFISTGLGGKGSKLRYFVVLINSYDKPFNDLQQKIIRTELSFQMKKHNCELEELSFLENYCTLMSVIPIKVPVREVFKGAIAECNQYGGFLRENFIVTNVKILDYEEIHEFVTKQNILDDNDLKQEESP